MLLLETSFIVIIAFVIAVFLACVFTVLGVLNSTAGRQWRIPHHVVYRSIFAVVSPALLFVWRLAALVYLISVWSIDKSWNGFESSYRFFSQWQFSLAILFFVIASTLSGRECISLWTTGSYATPHYKYVSYGGILAIVLFETSLVMSFSVFVARWGIIYPLDQRLDDFFGWNTHLVGFVLLLLEFVLNRMRLHALDVAFPIMFAIIYMCFAWIYNRTVDDFWAYPFLDVTIPLAVLWYFVVFVMIVIFYFVWYGISELKFRAHGYQMSRFDGIGTLL